MSDDTALPPEFFELVSTRADALEKADAVVNLAYAFLQAALPELPEKRRITQNTFTAHRFEIASTAPTNVEWTRENALTCTAQNSGLVKIWYETCYREKNGKLVSVGQETKATSIDAQLLPPIDAVNRVLAFLEENDSDLRTAIGKVMEKLQTAPRLKFVPY